MPKTNSAGVPSYFGHEGVVTNARDEKFELDPLKDLEGNPSPDLIRGEDAPDPIPVDGAEGVPSANTDAREYEERERKADEEYDREAQQDRSVHDRHAVPAGEEKAVTGTDKPERPIEQSKADSEVSNTTTGSPSPKRKK